jgi:hypothetical protein
MVKKNVGMNILWTKTNKDYNFAPELPNRCNSAHAFDVSNNEVDFFG